MTTKPEIRARRRGMTQAEMLADMDDRELSMNIRRGGIAAAAEKVRREDYFRIPSGRGDLERCCMIEAMQPDWRIS